MLKKIKIKYINLPIQVRASFWFLICTFTQKAVNVITTPIFTRLLSTSEYGEYNVYTSWLGIFTVFISLNLSQGVFMRGLLKYKNHKDEFASSMQFLTLILVLSSILIYLPLSHVINNMTNLNTTRTILMVLTIWLTSIFGFWAAEQRVDYQYKKLVPITLIVTITGQLFGIILIKNFEDKVTGRILGTLIIDALFYMWLFVIDIKKGKTFINIEYWRYALSFNIPLIPHYLSQVILNSSDRIMIERMVGTSAAGIYGLAYSISQVMTMFNTALAQTEEPWLYRKIQDNNIEAIKPVAYISVIFIAIVNLLLILLAPEIISVFAPKAYYDAVWIIPPIAMSVFFSFSYYFFAVFEYYYERTKPIAIASCIGAGVNIILNFVLIPVFGYYAAGYTTLLCFIIYATFHYYFMRKICFSELNGKEPFSLKVYLSIAFIFIVLGFLIQFTYNLRWIRYLFLVVFFAVSFLKRKTILLIINKLKNIKKGE